jgi:hypothetical protein
MRASLFLIPAAGLAALYALPSKADLDKSGSAARRSALESQGVTTINAVVPVSPGPTKAVTEMTMAARNFLASLDEGQKTQAVFKMDDSERQNWHFVPLDRKGITLQALRPDQDHLAYALLNSVLSNEGFAKTSTIMSQEKILFDMEKGSAMRNPEKYYLCIFGEPSETGVWGWRWEGHHTSCNVTIAGGKVVSLTPSFMGTNPGEVKDGPRKGLRVLGEEEDLARQLAKSLTDDQKKEALLTGDVPKEVLTGQERKVSALSPGGLASSKLDDTQRQIVWKLVEEYIGRFRPDLAIPVATKLSQDGWDKLTFAWSGGMERGQPHYYRIQSPEFVFEYDNTQNGANHAHAVWRDFANDFGEDLLKKHYQAEHPKKSE